MFEGDALEADALFKKYPHMSSYLDDVVLAALFDECIQTCIIHSHYIDVDSDVFLKAMK